MPPPLWRSETVTVTGSLAFMSLIISLDVEFKSLSWSLLLAAACCFDMVARDMHWASQMD